MRPEYTTQIEDGKHVQQVRESGEKLFRAS